MRLIQRQKTSLSNAAVLMLLAPMTSAAEAHRQEGNDLVARGEWAAASACYERGASVLPRLPPLCVSW